MKQADVKNMSYSELCPSKIHAFSQRREISLELEHVYVHASGTLDYRPCNNNSNSIKPHLNIIDYPLLSLFVIYGIMDHKNIIRQANNPMKFFYF